MQLRSGNEIPSAPRGNKPPTQSAPKKTASASTATKPPPWSSDVAAAMGRLLGSGLVESNWIKPPYEGTQWLSSVPRSFLFKQLPPVHYPVNVAMQFLAALESPIARDRVGNGWHAYLADCLTLLRESDDARQQPALWADAVKAANLIIEEVNAGLGHAYWLSFGTGSGTFGADPNNVLLNPYGDGALVIQEACWPGASLPQQPYPQPLNTALPVNDSNPRPVQTEPAHKRQKKSDHWGAWPNVSPASGGLPSQPPVVDPVRGALLALQQSTLLQLKESTPIELPDHFPQLPANRGDELSLILRLLVSIEDAIDADELEALLKKEPSCSALLRCCQDLLPHLSELNASVREAMNRLIRGLQNLIRHHVYTRT